MLNGWHKGERTGSGTIVWKAREMMARGEIDYKGFAELVASSAPSAGHCNTMGTASTMNSLAEALGMSLPGCASIPAPYRERQQISYETGKSHRRHGLGGPAPVTGPDPRGIRKRDRRELRHRRLDQRADPPQRRSRAISASNSTTTTGRRSATTSRCWSTCSRPGTTSARNTTAPVVCRPSRCRADRQGQDRCGAATTVNGKSFDRELRRENSRKIATSSRPTTLRCRAEAGFLNLKGNLFDSAIMKTSVISEPISASAISRTPMTRWPSRAVPSSSMAPRIITTASTIRRWRLTSTCLLFMRGARDPVGYPGAAEVVNMRAPDYLLKKGISDLPCIGDGRQSGTSGSPSILNASPEAATGGGLALLKTGDRVRIDLAKKRTADILISDDELEARQARRFADDGRLQVPGSPDPVAGNPARHRR